MLLITLSLFAQVVLWSGQGADLTTTLVAVQSGHFTEANPVLSNQPVRLVAVKVGTIAGIHYLLQRLSHDHPTLANVVAYAVGAVGVGAATVNLRRLRARCADCGR
jgi:uncharacterized membrane protein